METRERLLVLRPIAAWFSGAIWTVVIGILVASSIWIADISSSGILIVAIVLSLLLPMLFKSIQGNLHMFEPLTMTNVSLGMMFVGRPLADLITHTFDHAGYSVIPTFTEALVVALIGITALQIGYALPIGQHWSRYLPRPARFHPMRASLAAWIYLFIGGLLFWLFIHQSGGLGLLLFLLQGRAESDNDLFISSTGYLYGGVLLTAASALIFFALGTAARRRIYLLWFVVVILPLLIFYGARGDRLQLLPLTIATPTFWYLLKNKRPRVRTLAIGVLIGLSVLGWMRDLRISGQRGDVQNDLVKALMSPIEQFGEILQGADAEMFDSLANELVVVPGQLPFQHGAIAMDVVIRAIPRPLWPDKPLESNDAVVNALWPEHYALSRASPASSLIGSLYADSGLYTVAFGMFLIGICMSTLWWWFQRNSESVLAILIYSMALPLVVILMRGTIPDTMARALFILIPLCLLHVVMKLRLGFSSKISN